ncbi:hypothetical protein V6N13_121972 [Hibiscus sabdariffa]
MLLKPILTSYLGNAAFLLPSMESSTHTNLYKCHSCSCLNVAVVPGSRCPTNGHNQNLTFVNPTNKDLNSGDDGGSMLLMVVEEKVVAVGVNECVELLRASMQSKAVLSAVFKLNYFILQTETLEFL